jgi:hypothetical protein
MVLSVGLFQDGLVSGQVSITDLILDHDSGKLRPRAVRTQRASRGQQKAEKDIDNIDDTDIYEKTKKTTYHLSNVAETETGVNARRRILAFL